MLGRGTATPEADEKLRAAGFLPGRAFSYYLPSMPRSNNFGGAPDQERSMKFVDVDSDGKWQSGRGARWESPLFDDAWAAYCYAQAENWGE